MVYIKIIKENNCTFALLNFLFNITKLFFVGSWCSRSVLRGGSAWRSRSGGVWCGSRPPWQDDARRRTRSEWGKANKRKKASVQPC